MIDAEGGNYFDEMNWVCEKCKSQFSYNKIGFDSPIIDFLNS